MKRKRTPLAKRLMAAASAIALLFSLTSCTAPQKDSELAALPTLKATQDEIFLMDRAALTESEYIMLTSLQGITAQSEANIYIKDSDNTVYLERYLSEHSEITRREFHSVWELVAACMGSIAEKGCVLFEYGSNPTVNMAATISGVEGWLAVPVELKEQAQQAGLTVKRDLTEKDGGQYIATQESVFEEYQGRLNNNLVLHQSPELVTLRDYGIATKAFCFYTDEENRAEVKFRNRVFAWAKRNAPVLGWSADELGYVKQASENGLFVLPSDHCTNLSFLTGWDTQTPVEQRSRVQTITADSSKHYVALVMSDGDNVQWYETTLPFRDHFYDRAASSHDYKLTWTAPPLLQKLAPSVLRYIYGMASENDRFIAGVSGTGYINPTAYPQEYLADFVGASVSAMKDAGLSGLAILDNSTSKRKLKRAMATYAQRSEMNGALMQIGDKYEELGGEILWCGDKPFISARKSFWYTSDTEGETATKEWIAQFAEEINALPADIHSPDGYSYINIHPWSTTMADLDELVSLLDEDVELVFAEELIELVRANVPH